MQVLFHRNFEKRLTKCPKYIQEKFFSQLDLFYKNPYDEELHNHELHGMYKNSRSINITGDIRAIYEPKGMAAETITFTDTGSHSELYS